MNTVIPAYQKKQFLLFMLYFNEVPIENGVLSKRELLQLVHKLRKEGYKIEYNKKSRTYQLRSKDKPLYLDVEITKKHGDNLCEGRIFNSMHVVVRTSRKLNGSKYIRVRVNEIINDGNKLIIIEN